MAKILIVDDDPDFVVVSRTILEGEGYQVLAAANGQQALEIMHWGKPDLVLLDVMMSTTLEGVNVSREMEADPELKDRADRDGLFHRHYRVRQRVSRRSHPHRCLDLQADPASRAAQDSQAVRGIGHGPAEPGLVLAIRARSAGYSACAGFCPRTAFEGGYLYGVGKSSFSIDRAVFGP